MFLKVEEYFNVDSEILGVLWNSSRERYYSLCRREISLAIPVAGTMEVGKILEKPFGHRY